MGETYIGDIVFVEVQDDNTVLIALIPEGMGMAVEIYFTYSDGVLSTSEALAFEALTLTKE